MSEVPPLLLLLAFAVVAAVAWLMGRRAGAARTVRLPRDYFVGLDHLINDRFDRAAEVFARMAAREDAVEVQLALASLFRRRGEVDRAIAIHERLRSGAGNGVRNRAAFELALDYRSAGLLDRAEALLEELSATKEFRPSALEHLLLIQEQQGNWSEALRVFHALPKAAQRERCSEAAHYLCELAEQALRQGERARADALVRQACHHDQSLPRARLLGAELLAMEGRPVEALQACLATIEAAPAVTLEAVPRMLALARETGAAGVLEDLGERLQRSRQLSDRQVAWLLAAVIPTEDDTQLASPDGARGNAAVAVPGLGRLLARIGDAGARYFCGDCGLQSVGWYWRCPKCRRWDALQPAVFRWAGQPDSPTSH